MSWTASASGTKTATVPSTASFTNSSANIGVTNTAAAGDIVYFSTTGALPTNFAAGTPYYVLSSGLSSSNIQVSATPGGSAIAAGSAGSGTQTAIFEHVLAQDTTNATYSFEVDTLSNMALGDLTELRVYTQTLSGDSYLQLWKGSVAGAGIEKKAAPFVASDQAIQVTLKQLAGTGRAYKWKLLRQ
jgi:hypothetical protein